MNEQADWRPSASMAMLTLRAQLLAQCRLFFASRQVLEVETPVLSAFPVTEPHVASIATQPHPEALWLRPSPEYHMKRLLAAGSPDIYQIARCFRAGERGSQHQPEFTMIEWYRKAFSLESLYQECCGLIQELGALAGANYQHGELCMQVCRYSDLFVEHAGIDPLLANTDELAAAARAKLDQATCDALLRDPTVDRDSWIDLLTSLVIQPALPSHKLTVVVGYPADQAMLAQLDPDDPRVAQRFEVFLNGLELANGFVELCDAPEQSRRFAADQKKRKGHGLAEMAVDTYLLDALTAGLPACAGVALGLDRTIMALTDTPTLAQTMAFEPGR